MPKKPIERAREDQREGKALSTQAGEFVREEIDLIREGAHGARSTKQAIAIGLSKARRAGVKLPPSKKGIVSEETRKKAKRDLEKAREGGPPTSRKRSQATLKALKRESGAATLARSLAARALPNAPPPRKRPLELARSDKPRLLGDYSAVIGGACAILQSRLAG